MKVKFVIPVIDTETGTYEYHGRDFGMDEYFNMIYSKSNLEEYFYDVSRESNFSTEWITELLYNSVKNGSIFVSGDYTDDEEVIAIREVKNEQILF